MLMKCLIKCLVQTSTASPTWSAYVRNGSLFWWLHWFDKQLSRFIILRLWVGFCSHSVFEKENAKFLGYEHKCHNLVPSIWMVSWHLFTQHIFSCLANSLLYLPRGSVTSKSFLCNCKKCVKGGLLLKRESIFEQKKYCSCDCKYMVILWGNIWSKYELLYVSK